ncbi:hypothetical protein LLG96_04925 [bacterium]|nr:hypothetical protein [bacterium]
MSDDSLKKIDAGKRAFLKKVAAATVFTVPVVQSFSMKGLSTPDAEAASDKKVAAPPVSPI